MQLPPELFRIIIDIGNSIDVANSDVGSFSKAEMTGENFLEMAIWRYYSFPVQHLEEKLFGIIASQGYLSDNDYSTYNYETILLNEMYERLDSYLDIYLKPYTEVEGTLTKVEVIGRTAFLTFRNGY